MEDIITELQKKLETAEKEAGYYRELNQNLLRISRERANADRNLQPKKQHSGYAVLVSLEKELRYFIGGAYQAVKIWETVIQTPFSIRFTEEQARRQSFEELLTNAGGWKLGKIGICARNLRPLNTIMENSEYSCSWNSKNTAYQFFMKADYRNGYWEFVVRHSLPLEEVPEDMRPWKARKNKKAKINSQKTRDNDG